MQWLNTVVDEAIKKHPEGEIIVESGVSPSGVYHVGTLREVLTCDAVMLGLHRAGRQAKHIHYVDDLDVFRKVPVNVPAEFEKYLGKPLCDVPAPDGSDQSYADYFLKDFLGVAEKLYLEMEVIRSHEKYRDGVMIPATEKALARVDEIRKIIEEVSGRKLDENWAPIQVMEDGYLKNRRFVSIDTQAKVVTYLNPDNNEIKIGYTHGEVKLNWRVDWPARWWMLGVGVEPFGRDHATKGGSYDTGAEIIRKVFEAEPPVPVPYNFINLTGETKKMSKSTGEIIAISDLAKVLPAEVIRYFTFRFSPDKQLFFDQNDGVTKLIDDYAALLVKPDKSNDDKQLVELSGMGKDSMVSTIPFSHLVASFQAARHDVDVTLSVLRRTPEYAEKVSQEEDIVRRQLGFTHKWLENWAPEDTKFEIRTSPPSHYSFTDSEKQFFKGLADKIEKAPTDADGEWFHKTIYEFKDDNDALPSIRLFNSLYRLLISKESGPRAGWFLSDLNRQDHEWLIKRLRLEA